MKLLISSTIERYWKILYEAAACISWGSSPLNSAKSLSGNGAGPVIPAHSSSITCTNLTLARLSVQWKHRNSLRCRRRRRCRASCNISFLGDEGGKPRLPQPYNPYIASLGYGETLSGARRSAATTRALIIQWAREKDIFRIHGVCTYTYTHLGLPTVSRPALTSRGL